MHGKTTIKITPACFGSRGIHHQGVSQSFSARRKTHTHTHTPQVHNMPPNTDQAHNKHIWSIIYNFSQVQVITPWWWILCDPKHVGVIFKVCLLDFYTTQILNSTSVIIECISWLIKVTDNNDARWKPVIIRISSWFNVQSVEVWKREKTPGVLLLQTFSVPRCWPHENIMALLQNIYY
jgi:hypothetical protein